MPNWTTTPMPRSGPAWIPTELHKISRNFHLSQAEDIGELKVLLTLRARICHHLRQPQAGQRPLL